MLAVKTTAEEAFRLEVRAWLAANVPAPIHDTGPLARREYALAWQRRQYEGGWAGISWPQRYGGRGLSDDQQIIWYEEYAHAGAPSTLDVNFVAQHHAGPTLIALGSEAQRAFHLPRILRGESLWCQGFSEPGAGSDLASLQTRGTIVGDRVIVSGQKLWSSYADIADYQELLVRTDASAERHKGLTWLICDMRTPGITVNPIRNIAGSANFAAVFYDDVVIPLDQVVGAVNDGWKVAMATLGFERGTASIALQIELQNAIERLMDDAARSPKARSDSALIEQLTLLWAQAAALRSLTYSIISRTSTGSSGNFDASMVRLRYAELIQDVHRLGFKISGTDGLTHPGARGWTHSYLYSLHDTIAGGTSEIQRNVISERILGLPRGT
jgi:alkylation response protein AidB-like acyl-CoA dehydrogenase